MIRMLTAALLALSFLITPSKAQDTNNPELKFEPRHRVNAHGNEFNALVKSADGKRLFVATEKGEIIVWNIASQRVEQTFRQPGPIHFLAPLSQTEILAVGANHVEPVKALVRRWNVETGQFVDLAMVDENSFPSALATDSESKLAAVTMVQGDVVVWDLVTNNQLATWKFKETPIAVALIGRNVFVSAIDQKAVSAEWQNGENAILKLNLDKPEQPPAEFLRVPKRVWTALGTSPDHRLLTANFQSGPQEGTVFIEPATKAQVGNFPGSALAWIDPSKLVLFESLDPSEIVQVPTRGAAKSMRKLARMESDTEGRAFELTGQVANADGSKVWASYQKGPGLLEFDLTTNKIKTLIQGPSGAYAISASDQNSELLTGGADGYVRLWKLADLSLAKEFHVAAAGDFVTDVHFLADGRRAIVGTMRMKKRLEPNVDPVQIWLLDLETGQQSKILDIHWWRARVAIVDDRIVYPEGDGLKLTSISSTQDTRELKAPGLITATAISPNRRSLAVTDNKNNLTVFDLLTFQKKSIAAQPDDWGPIVVTNDGRYVYQLANEGELTKWDMETAQVTRSTLSRISEMHSRVDFMTLANDDEWLVAAGNHADVGIFDRASGRLLFYTRFASAAFYVERVWLNGKHIVFTTDIGVMIDGNLVC